MSAVQNQTQFAIGALVVDRRERRPVTMRGFVAREDGTTAEILVRDLSYDGCGVEIPVRLVAREIIKLSVLSRPAIKAEVRWFSNGRAGLTFVTEVESAQTPHKRKSERINLQAIVTSRRLGRAKYRVQVVDMSPEGCKLELIERPRIGEHIFIKFLGTDVLPAEVCWTDTRYAGVRFEYPIHPGVFELMLARFKDGCLT